jgi:hypothetical protein
MVAFQAGEVPVVGSEVLNWLRNRPIRPSFGHNTTQVCTILVHTANKFTGLAAFPLSREPYLHTLSQDSPMPDKFHRPISHSDPGRKIDLDQKKSF